MITRLTKTTQIPFGRICSLLVALLIYMSTTTTTVNAAPWTEPFENPNVKLRDGGGNARYQFQQITSINSGQHGGRRCAYLKVVGQGGSHVYTTLNVGRPLIIPELYPTVWIKSDRTGIRLFARAILPRTIDPNTGQPLTMLLDGTSYTATGSWQMLEISNLPKQLKQKIQVARTQAKHVIDGRGAYIDQFVLNVYGGAGTTNVWVDDATIYGYVEMTLPNRGPATGSPIYRESGNWSASTNRPNQAPNNYIQNNPGRTVIPARRFGGNHANNYNHRAVHNSKPLRNVELKGAELYVDNSPILVRAIRYRGESLATLKKLGFNAVWLTEEASPNLLAEAQATDLFVICAPPKFIQVDIPPNSTAPSPKIGPEYNQVLAWNLGHNLLESHVESVRKLANQTRAADDQQARPLICSPKASLRAFSMPPINLLLIGRSPLGTSLELSDYGTWIRERPRLARPGTPVWSTIQTEVSKELYDQWRLSGQSVSPPPMLSAEQIRLTAYTAIAAGSRGLLFESRESLEKSDPMTLARATALAILNIELELIRPWVAAGTLIDTVKGDQPNTAGAVFRYNRSRLLVPIWVGPGAQLVPGQSAGNTISFTVPVPESNRAYEITPGTLRPVKSRKRVRGGVSVTLSEFSLSTLILFTEDAKTIHSMNHRAKKIGEKAARLHRRLAESKLTMVQEVNRRMAAYPKSIWDTSDHLRESRKRLQECDGAIAAHDWAAACIAADRAMRPLRIVERTNWSRAIGNLHSPVASPATICFSTLPWHWNLAGQARSWQRSGNRILGGDFERLEQVCAAGWTNYTYPNSGVETQVDITSEAAHTGTCGIRLRATPKDPESKPTLVETPPTWIRSPTIQVAAGSIVRIEGWVHIPTPITGSVDGLIIFDSMTGEALAERIGETTGWRPFVLYRIATKTGPMTVTMALAGMGEVWLDDISIQTLTAAPVATRPMGTAPR